MVSDAEKCRVGALIRARRQELGWDQATLGSRVGKSRNAVSNVENGRSYPSRWAGKAEAVLGISLTGDEQDPVVAEIRDLAARIGVDPDEWIAKRKAARAFPQERAG